MFQFLNVASCINSRTTRTRRAARESATPSTGCSTTVSISLLFTLQLPQVDVEERQKKSLRFRTCDGRSMNFVMGDSEFQCTMACEKQDRTRTAAAHLTLPTCKVTRVEAGQESRQGGGKGRGGLTSRNNLDGFCCSSIMQGGRV